MIHPRSRSAALSYTQYSNNDQRDVQFVRDNRGHKSEDVFANIQFQVGGQRRIDIVWVLLALISFIVHAIPNAANINS